MEENLADRIKKDFTPVDFIAIIVICGGFLLMAFHVNTITGGIVTMVVGYYFGRKSK